MSEWNLVLWQKANAKLPFQFYPKRLIGEIIHLLQKQSEFLKK